jgi:phage FluMu protein Com
MNYQTIKCKNCGNNFVFSSEEQELYLKRGLSGPEHCPICRGIIEARSKDKARSKYER